MATIRELRDRIKSVNSTKKITKAQEMVATSRISRAQARVEASLPYAHEIQRVVERLASASSLDHPMLRERPEGKVAAILVVSSDRGQAGAYNNNVFKKAAELQKKLEDEGYEVVRYVTGKKAIAFYEFREADIYGQWTGFSQDPTWDATHDVRHHMVDGFIAGSEGEAKNREGVNATGDTVPGFDQVHVVYTEFVSMLTQRARAQQLLPIEPVITEDEFETSEGMFSPDVDSPGADYDFEPDPETLLSELLPKFVYRSLYAIFLEASAAESAARRTAMKAATDNATELIEDLSREANAARQAQITQEITEIIGGAGALADSGESD